MPKIIKKKKMTNSREKDIYVAQSITFLLYQITNALTHNFRDELGVEKITISEWRIVSCLNFAGGRISIGDLSSSTVIKQPIVSRIVTEMEQKDLVRKIQGSEDQRVIYVQLTKEGAALFESISPIAVQIRDRTLEGLSRHERKLMRKMLIQIQENLGIRNPYDQVSQQQGKD